MRRPGFTLAEVVFATALVALSLFFMISLIPTANLSLRKGEDLESTALYGQQVVESIRTALSNNQALPTTQTSTVTLNTTDFKLDQSVTPVLRQGTYTLYEIVVTLTRTDGKGAPIQLVTRATVRTL